MFKQNVYVFWHVGKSLLSDLDVAQHMQLEYTIEITTCCLKCELKAPTCCLKCELKALTLYRAWQIAVQWGIP